MAYFPKFNRRRKLLFLYAASPALIAFMFANGAGAAADNPPPAPADLFTPPSSSFLLTGLLAVGFLVSCALVRSALYQTKWNLADAMSEEADITLRDAQNAPILDAAGKPAIGSELRASTSRFIAMFGLIAILILYFGFGLVLVKRLSAAEPLPNPDEMKVIQTFLLSGLTLFAPYIVNKFSSVFDWLKPPPRP